MTTPEPGGARTLDELVERLRALKVWAGDPSYEVITARINHAWAGSGRPEAELARRGTVVDCFKRGRRRLNADLWVAVVQALHPDTGYVSQWRQALRAVLGETRAAAQVRVQDSLPGDLAGFTGRTAELDRLRLVDRGVVVIEGMAGIGKTRLAIHAGHRAGPFDRIFFVDLRGFHPDPAQPPADPAAVLDSLLRLLGVAGQQIPHDVAARGELFRKLLAGQRVLLVLDDAADEAQVRPLLPGPPNTAGQPGAPAGQSGVPAQPGTPAEPGLAGCLAIVTSRRGLAGLDGAVRLRLTVFAQDEAAGFLKLAAPEVPVGHDPEALDRVARRCGGLPLALGLIAARMREAAGWTLTDHADRLDERHRHQRLESGVELALSLSYDSLPPEGRRLLRLLALHPGPDFDAYAAAALSGSGPASPPPPGSSTPGSSAPSSTTPGSTALSPGTPGSTALSPGTPDSSAVEGLRVLCREHLLYEGPPGRYAMHDLVRAHAAQLAGDEDPPSERDGAMERLFDYYLSASAAAMDALHPADRHHRPEIPPTGAVLPLFESIEAARGWLDTERTNLMETAIRANALDRHWHVTRLAGVLIKYLIGGYFTDAITIFEQARMAAQRVGDPAQEAQALFGLGTVHSRLSRHAEATDHLERALERFREAGDLVGQARTLGNLGAVAQRRADYRQATAYHEQALALFDLMHDRVGAARALNNLGEIESRLGRYAEAVAHLRRGLELHRQAGDQSGQAAALTNLGTVEERRGSHAAAAANHRKALELYRLLGHHSGQAWTLDGIGSACTGMGHLDDAVEHHQQALELFRRIGERDGEASALNGLGEAAHLAGQRDQAIARHSAALAVAEGAEVLDQEARAHEGLARAHRNQDTAREHWQRALSRYAELGAPEAARVRAELNGRTDLKVPEELKVAEDLKVPAGAGDGVGEGG